MNPRKGLVLDANILLTKNGTVREVLLSFPCRRTGCDNDLWTPVVVLGIIVCVKSRTTRLSAHT